MQQILQNLALIHLTEFAKKNNIDISGTHAIKNGRGYNYSLCSDKTRQAIITVCFHKSSVPSFLIHK